MRVLLADDSKVARIFLSRLLADLGMAEVVQAADGVQAQAALAQGTFDLLLLDMHMPQLDGLQVLEELRRDPTAKYARTPVVMISAESDPREIERARALGVGGYLEKPYRKEGLAAAIEAARQAAAAAP